MSLAADVLRTAFLESPCGLGEQFAVVYQNDTDGQVRFDIEPLQGVITREEAETKLQAWQDKNQSCLVLYVVKGYLYEFDAPTGVITVGPTVRRL